MGSGGGGGGGGVINQVTFAIFKTIFINIVETPWVRKIINIKTKVKIMCQQGYISYKISEL